MHICVTRPQWHGPILSQILRICTYPYEARFWWSVMTSWSHAYYTPSFNEVDRGVYWYHLVRLSVCPSVRPSVCPSVSLSVCGQNCVRSVSSRILIGKFWWFFKICYFDFVFFWLGIQYDSMVWVIMRWRGVSSERRRSSSSSSQLLHCVKCGVRLGLSIKRPKPNNTILQSVVPEVPILNYTPCSTCGQNHVWCVSSTILILSISYLHTLSSDFRGCVACKVFFLHSKTWRFGKFFKFVTLNLSCFDLGSNMNWSIVWAWDPIWTSQ